MKKSFALASFLTLFTLAAMAAPSIGLQLYSLRADFDKDVPGTLQKVHDYGIKLVELAGTYKLTPEQFKEELKKHDLKPVSGHFAYEKYRDDLDSVVRDAKTLGLQYAGCAWIPHQGDFDEPTCRAAAAVFNRAGEALSKAGIKFFYHTHGYEFQPYGDGTLFDLLVKETDPRFANFQMDVFWIVHPGQDPVKLLGRYSKRWVLMHVKDMKKGTPTGLLTGHSDVSNDVTIGTGIMDWPAIMKAAKKTSIKYYFIEDESPTAAQQIPESLKFLTNLKY